MVPEQNGILSAEATIQSEEKSGSQTIPDHRIRVHRDVNRIL